MAQADLSESENIQQGKVQQACKEWLVREDNAIAHRIQDEEFNDYYSGNRFKHRIVRDDRQKAKHIQQQEEYERLILYQKEKEMLALEDEQIARAIQKEEARRAQEISTIEAEDAKLAQRLQEKEKEKLRRRRLQKERLEVEKIRLEKFGSHNPDLLHAVNRTIADMQRREDEPSTSTAHSSHNDIEEDIGDLSEFCMKPPPGLNAEEMRIFMAEQDEELARFLQQYETKSKNQISREKQHFIEAQDYEIARILQEEERVRAKKLREKRKLRAKRSDPGPENIHENIPANANTQVESTSTFQGTLQSRQLLPEVAVPTCESTDPDLLSSTTSTTNYEYAQDEASGKVNEEDDIELAINDPTRRALPPIPSFHNVAMDLDPTYKRKNKQAAKIKLKQKNDQPDQAQPLSSSPTDLAGVHFAQLCRVTPSPTKSQTPQSTLTKNSLKRDLKSHSHDPEVSYPDYESHPLPPILPMQGQRRISTNEKRKNKTKETCRTQ